MIYLFLFTFQLIFSTLLFFPFSVHFITNFLFFTRIIIRFSRFSIRILIDHLPFRFHPPRIHIFISFIAGLRALKRSNSFVRLHIRK